MGIRKQAFHDTAVARKNAVFAEELADFHEGDRVMTIDGFPGRVTAVLFGPYQGTESYQVELDGGMGGGDYSLGMLKPLNRSTAARVEAVEVTATTDHVATVDYPELEDILDRLPNEQIKIYAAVNQDDKMDRPDSSKDDSGENLEQDEEVQDPKLDNVDNPEADPADPDLDGEEEGGKAKLGDVTPPSACSNCGGASFGDKQMTGRGVRMRCNQCGATMKSWGGQWEPEFPNSPQNNASEMWDYRSGGPGGIGQAPGGQPFDPQNQTDPNANPADNLKGKDEDDDEDGKTIKIKVSKIVSQMSRPEIAESLQAEAGIVQHLFNRMYQKAQAKYERDQVQWWQPPENLVGTNTVGPPQYNLITPKQVMLGSVSEYDDPEWRWHFTASWMDVQAKAARIRRAKHVKIVSASKMFVAAEVQGENNTYETQLNYVPGTRKVADWACGCKWASYAWGRSKRYARFEGRLCSHALATQYEATARGIFGRDVRMDTVRPDWQDASSPVVVRYDKATGDQSRPATLPPVRRRFSSLVIDSDGIFPVPELIDLAHPPVYASIQTMLDHDAELGDVIEMLASVGVDLPTARGLVLEALLSPAVDEGYLGHVEASESVSESTTGPGKGCAVCGHSIRDHDDSARHCDSCPEGEGDHRYKVRSHEASKQHPKHKKPVNQEHGITYGRGYGLPWAWCGLCGGSGCNNCSGTGQVAQSDPAAVGDGGAVDAGGGAADSGGGATASLHVEADYSTADPLVSMDGTQNNFWVRTPHSNSENPASSGWATSQDPGDWGKSLISNNFGVTFDASLHMEAIEKFDVPEHRVQEYASNGRPMIDSPMSRSFESRQTAERYLDWLHREHHENWGERMPEGKYRIHSPAPRVIEHEPRGFELPGRTIDAALQGGVDGPPSEAALEHTDAMLHDEPEGALPSTDGAEEQDIVADPGAGNTSAGPFGADVNTNSTGNIPNVDKYNTISSVGAQSDAEIIAEFHRTAGAKALAKEGMREFNFDEQQELINEGKGDRARNYGDLRIAGTHYELIGDGDDDETILWI